ncbi:PEP-utilizing enzyme [Nanoarchaeota archaeon]
MKRNPDLIEKKLPILKQQVYYRQRFDACPHFMFFIGEAHGSDTNHSKYPFAQRFTCAHFSENKGDWFHPFKELEYTAKKITDLTPTNPNIADEMIKEFRQWEDQFYQECHSLSTLNLKPLSNQQLLETYNHLYHIYLKKCNPSPLIDGFALTTDTVISRKIELHLEKNNQLKRFVKDFETLTAPTFLSFLQLEEIDFLTTTEQINQNPDQKTTLLKQHQQRYFWINNNYVHDNILPLQYFEDRYQELKDSDPNNKIQQLRLLPKTNQKKKDQLIKELDLPQEIITLLNITDRFSYWQDERKKGTFWATHYFNLLLEEFAARTKYSLDNLKYAMPPEMDLILKEQIPTEELEARFRSCYIYWTQDQYDLSTDPNLPKKISQEQTQEIDKEIRGMSVSLGKVIGPAKIVDSIDKLNKISEGDILVAVMTRPDYLPAMKKAAGFITDEGGITCHAAIVARELKVPCIVGTRIATKILKDNTIVELDANHSTITILKQE